MARRLVLIQQQENNVDHTRPPKPRRGVSSASQSRHHLPGHTGMHELITHNLMQQYSLYRFIFFLKILNHSCHK
jgi:hypothetical protein